MLGSDDGVYSSLLLVFEMHQQHLEKHKNEF
jgi:hypothetical protein